MTISRFFALLILFFALFSASEAQAETVTLPPLPEWAPPDSARASSYQYNNSGLGKLISEFDEAAAYRTVPANGADNSLAAISQRQPGAAVAR